MKSDRVIVGGHVCHVNTFFSILISGNGVRWHIWLRPLSNLSLLNVELNETKNIYHKTYDL